MDKQAVLIDTIRMFLDSVEPNKQKQIEALAFVLSNHMILQNNFRLDCQVITVDDVKYLMSTTCEPVVKVPQDATFH